MLLITMCIGISAEDAVVAKIDTTEYTSLAQAINAAKDGETIIVTANTTLSETLEVKNKNITIKSERADDIKTITYVSNYITVTADEGKTGSLTLENITITKQKGSANGKYAILYPNNNGTVILNSGTTIKDSASAHAGAAFAERGGAIVMNDGALVENCSNQWRSGAFHVDHGSFTMNGGTISNSVNGAVGLGNGADASANATITLNGGKITGTTGRAAVKTYNGTSITISDNVVFSGNTVANIQYVSGTTVNVKADSGNLKTALNLAFTNNENTNPTIILTKATEANRKVKDDNYFNDKVFTVEGNGNTLSIEKDFPMWGDKGHITFKNVTVEMDNFILGNSSKMTFDEGSVLTTPAAGVTGKVISVQGGGSFTPTITMKNGSAIKNAKSTGRVISLDIGAATLNMEDGVTVKGVEAQRLVDCYQQSILNIAGATIKDNTFTTGVVYAVAKTINVTNPSALTIENNGTNRIIVVADTNDITVNVTGDWKNAVAADGKNYYVNADYVAHDGTYMYTDLLSALSRKTGQTVTILRDCTFEDTMPGESSYTLDGGNHTITIKKVISLAGASIVTWKNVNVNVNLDTGVTNNTSAFKIWDTSKFILGEGAVVTSSAPENLQHFVEINSGTTFELNGGKITGIKKPQEGTSAPALLVNGGGTFNMISGYITDNEAHTEGAIIIQQNGVMNMSGGEISGNKAQLGGAIGIYGGTLNMSGGKITGNSAWEGSAIRTGGSAATVLNFSGNAYVYGNNSKNPQVENIAQKGATITVKNFTGKLGINQRRESNKVLGVVVGTEFGTAEGTLPTVGTIVSDADDSIFACISGGKLIWTTKAGLAIETDTGKYTNTGDETVYGVIRILTKSNSGAAVPVESFGTAYVKNGADETSINTKAAYNFTKNETFENGKGYIVDVVDVNTGATYTYIPVSYYKIAGIDEMVYVTGTPVTFNVENAKDLGKDPADLNY